MNDRIVFFEKSLFLLLVFLIPSQLALHFWPNYALVFGIRVDYLSPTIYLTDIFAISLIAIWIFSSTKNFTKTLNNKKWVLYIFFTIAFLNSFFSTMWLVTLLRWIKVFELILLFFYVRYRNINIKVEEFFKTLFYSAAFFSVLGIFQVLKGTSVGGIFYWLGERSFSINTPGIALFSFEGKEILRSYSTFPHPNSMGGYLGVVILFLVTNPEIVKKNKFIQFCFLVICFDFVLSFSFGSFLGILVVLFAIFLYRKNNFTAFKKIFWLGIIASLLSPFYIFYFYNVFKNLGAPFTERINLFYVSGRMMQERFFFGEGLNTFVLNLVKYRSLSGYLWLLQPVHNIFILAFSEGGFVVFLLLFFIFYIFLFKKTTAKTEVVASILFIFLTGLFDHYWLTLQQNILLFCLVLALQDKLDKKFL